MEYLWLSVYVKLNYSTYINLMKIFKNAENMYVISQDKNEFDKMIQHIGIHIDYRVYSNLINLDLKHKSKMLYSNLQGDNIKIINIDSKYYPKQLINVSNPPLVIYAYGNLSLLKSKIIYMYNSDNFSYNGKKVYDDFCKLLNYNNISIISDKITEYSKVVYLPSMKKIGRKDILFISDKIEKNLYINYECITGISNYLFISEANYNIKIAMIVDLILEQGKDIFVVPGSIYNKEAYFSNFLIKEGAICITSKADLLNYLK